MGLLVSRPSDQQRLSSTSVVQSEWMPTGIAEETADTVVEKSFYYNAENISARERSEIKLSISKTASIQENPFLDDTDRSSVKVTSQLRKTASGRLLDPVDVISPEAPTRNLERTASEAESDTEKEPEVDEEEEDDSPYLIENSDPSSTHDNSTHAVNHEVSAQVQTSFADELDDTSDLSEMSDTEDDGENGPTAENEEGRYLSVDLASDGNETTTKNGRRPSSTTASFSTTKGSSSDLDRHASPTIPGRRPKKVRERKTWAKPILGDEEDNPFIASSTASKPKKHRTEIQGGGSWLRTDNAKTRRTEGEKPTIDYLLCVILLWFCRTLLLIKTYLLLAEVKRQPLPTHTTCTTPIDHLRLRFFRLNTLNSRRHRYLLRGCCSREYTEKAIHPMTTKRPCCVKGGGTSFLGTWHHLRPLRRRFPLHERFNEEYLLRFRLWHDKVLPFLKRLTERKLNDDPRNHNRQVDPQMPRRSVRWMLSLTAQQMGMTMKMSSC